ncbi:MAG: hypothetical protein WBL27_13445 [Salinimicrobium sp.]
MKFRILLFLVILSGCSSSQKVPKHLAYYDETGTLTTQENFIQKWRDKENGHARWDVIQDGERKIALSSPLFSTYLIEYSPLLRNLERITGRRFAVNSVIVLAYEYADDLCSSRSSNTWNKRKIGNRKSFLQPIREDVLGVSKNVIYLHLFEEGIELKNDPANNDEYFFVDKDNFFRNNIFRDPSFCGSFALIKPNGQVLVRNGEYRADWLLPLLQPQNWNTFFP